MEHKIPFELIQYIFGANRRGATGRCSTAVREVPGSNPGSVMNVVSVWCWYLFFVSCRGFEKRLSGYLILTNGKKKISFVDESGEYRQ